MTQSTSPFCRPAVTSVLTAAVATRVTSRALPACPVARSLRSCLRKPKRSSRGLSVNLSDHEVVKTIEFDPTAEYREDLLNLDTWAMTHGYNPRSHTEATSSSKSQEGRVRSCLESLSDCGDHPFVIADQLAEHKYSALRDGRELAERLGTGLW